MRSRPSGEKRRKEMQRQERQREKAERRKTRKEERLQRVGSEDEGATEVAPDVHSVDGAPDGRAPAASEGTQAHTDAAHTAARDG